MAIFIDTSSYYKVFLIALVLRMITLYAAISKGVVIIVFLLYLVAWHQIRDRYYVGLKILPIAIVVDLAYALLIFRNQFVTTTAIMFTSFMVIFWLMTLNEQRHLPRPLYAMNEEETARARKALKTKDPRDFENVIQYKDFSAIDKEVR